MLKIHKKSFFLTIAVLFATAVTGFAAEDPTVAHGGGHGGGGHGGSGSHSGFGDRGDNHHGNFDRRGGYGEWGGGGYGGYAAPVYPDYPFYLPPPTPAEAFPDDAAQDSIYERNQHPPR